MCRIGSEFVGSWTDLYRNASFTQGVDPRLQPVLGQSFRDIYSGVLAGPNGIVHLPTSLASIDICEPGPVTEAETVTESVPVFPSSQAPLPHPRAGECPSVKSCARVGAASVRRVSLPVRGLACERRQPLRHARP